MVTSVSCFCRPPALYECLGGGGSPCAGVTVGHTHSTTRAEQGHGEGGQARLGGAVTHLGGRLRLTYTERKGCVSPTRASASLVTG